MATPIRQPARERNHAWSGLMRRGQERPLDSRRQGGVGRSSRHWVSRGIGREIGGVAIIHRMDFRLIYLNGV